MNSHSTSVATAANRTPPGAACSACSPVGPRRARARCGRTRTALVMHTTSSTILMRKDSVMNWRTGSAMVSSSAGDRHQHHPGPQEGCEAVATPAASGSSARIRPSTRSATARMDTNTTPTIMMWMDCRKGTTQLAVFSAVLNERGLQARREVLDAHRRLAVT